MDEAYHVGNFGFVCQGLDEMYTMVKFSIRG